MAADNAEVSRGDALAQAAAGLIGTPFRLYGRDVETGLDCIGLLHESLRRIGVSAPAPSGYSLRNSAPSRWFAAAGQYGLEEATGSDRRGDVLLVQPGPGQQHIQIIEASSEIIHAHAGIGRVVRGRRDPTLTTVARWRFPS